MPVTILNVTANYDIIIINQMFAHYPTGLNCDLAINLTLY